jgi:opacity protein-like surface antigen
MGKIQTILLGCVLAVAPVAMAGAADLGPYKPPVVEVPAPAPIPVYGGKYLKGYVGMTNQHIDTFTNDEIRNGNFVIVHHGFDSAPLWGIGLGYDTGHYFRFDVTGEYRGRSYFRGLDIETTQPYTNEHTGYKSEWLLLANAYIDLGTWKSITPYVGAGIGTVNVKLHDFWDVNLVNNGLWFANDHSQWNFAWALHAGLAYDVTDNFTVDLAYRYVNLGDGKTGTYGTYDDGTAVGSATVLKDLYSHDLMLGVRWKLGHAAPTPDYVTWK